MAAYGRYEVIVYPSGYAVTDMQTHTWAHEKLIMDRGKAHALARRLQHDAALAERLRSDPNAADRFSLSI